MEYKFIFLEQKMFNKQNKTKNYSEKTSTKEKRCFSTLKKVMFTLD